MTMLPEVIAGVIVSGPTAEATPSTISYVADVNIDGTLHSGVTINRPVIQQWGTLVRPMLPGTGILGVKHGEYCQWHFRELPATGPCVTGGGGGGGGGESPSIPIGSPPVDGGRPMGGGTFRPISRSSLVGMLLMHSTESELRMLKRALEAVQ